MESKVVMAQTEPKAFDPYHKWLGIRGGGTPPNHFRLLGLELWESDEDVIRDTAARQINHLRSFRHGRHHEFYERLLDEMLTARDTLLKPELRAEYESRLKRELQESRPQPESAAPDSATGRGAGISFVPEATPVFAANACSECGHENTASCQFCIACGGALWEPCIECSTVCRRGALHCGACGVNLTAAIQSRIESIRRALAEAGQLRHRHQYHECLHFLISSWVTNIPDWPNSINKC